MRLCSPRSSVFLAVFLQRKFDTLLAEGYFVPHIARRRPNTTEFPISPAAVYRFNKASMLALS